ncbi:NAD(P)/FAD-dependent oxidoreductase [Amycolatopsis sp. NPDC005961]|uniref:NAD(P)/FAD-dependent oxidoreductase n=1 Tax=Amycolatopsis sp. NPDC005961 TaxID=3156720 RepID=UPI0033E529DB
MKHLDVAVLGGGPAGSATALLLARRGADVGLYAAPGHERPRLGESLPPAVNPVLHELGVAAGFAALGALPSYGTSGAWGTGEVSSQSFLFSPHGTGWHVDRTRFDEMLTTAAARAGATVFPSRVRRVHRIVGGFAVDAAIPAHADAVVDATGRAARISRELGARPARHDRLVCAARIVPRRGDEPFCDTFVEAVADGWWYSAPLPDGHRIVACFTDAPIAARAGLATPAGWLAALAATTHVRQFVRGRAGSPVRVVTAAGHRLRPGAAGPGWLAVGDAAFATDPLSSGGVTSALRMATAAADALTAGDRAHYVALVDGMAADYFARYSEIYGWERRFPGSEFWRARLPGVTNSTTSPEPRRPPAASRRSCSSGTGPRSRPES